MGPAIALRLRQHLTLTPQVQQALRLLQMSALEFAQEREQALNEKFGTGTYSFHLIFDNGQRSDFSVVLSK